MISVIIPTYKSPEVLDLCLRSCIQGQRNTNQIIVVVDGFYEVNRAVLEKYKDSIQVLILAENVGLCRATNLGVYNAEFDKILIVNDDNVFPKYWDKLLLNNYEPNSVIAPNQIEPIPSMFKQFHIHNLARDPKTFDLEEFWLYSDALSVNSMEESGSTLPIFMSKTDYLRVGGWDESYDMIMVADWDFFLKCELSGMKMVRTYACHFYHFASVSFNGEKRQQDEQRGHEYFKYKWGQYAKHNPINNSKLL